MTWTRLAFALLFTLLFLEILIGFPISLDRPEPPVSSPKDMQAVAEKKFEGVHVVETKEGVRDWELFSDQAEAFETQNQWKLQRVKVIFFSENQVQFTVTGDRGWVDTQSKDIEIVGEVVMLSPLGYRYQSDKLFYQASRRRLHTPEPVSLRGPASQGAKESQIRVQSMGLESFVDEKRVRLLKSVQAQRQVLNREELKISSSQAEFSNLDHSVLFSGQVQVLQGNLKIEAPEMEMRTQESQDVLKSVLFRGGVKLMDDRKFASSDQVLFDPELNQFELQGKPRVVQDQDEILGEKIVLLDGGRKIRVDQVKAHVEKLDP